MVEAWRYEDEWFKEGNVSKKLKEWFESQDYMIEQFVENKKKRGKDMVVSKNGKRIVIEVKGYPSKYYVDPRKQGHEKKTSPTLQARHWFSHALLSLMKAKSDSPKSIVAMGLPYSNRYENLIEGVSYAAKLMGLQFYFVKKDGSVYIYDLK